MGVMFIGKDKKGKLYLVMKAGAGSIYYEMNFVGSYAKTRRLSKEVTPLKVREGKEVDIYGK